MNNFLFLFIFLTFGLVYRLLDWGVFTSTPDYNIENCQVIGKFPGPEDIQVDSSNDILYISSSNYEASNIGKPYKGGIYILDLKLKDPQPKLVSLDGPSDFKPHGINLYRDPNTGEKTLFVVNHQANRHTIEAFDVIDRENIKHRETFTSEKVFSPNDVLGVGKNSFYVSQDNKCSNSKWKLLLASFLGLEGGSVFYYNGNDWKIVVEDLHYANGMACSRDKKMFYVSETNRMRIKAYERNLETGDLTFKESIELKAGPDNINVDDEGNLWVAAFPNMLDVGKYLAGKTTKCAVQISKLSFKGDKVDIKNMLTSSGEEISGVTAVDLYRNKMIISGLLTPEVRMCSLPQDTQIGDKKNEDL